MGDPMVIMTIMAIMGMDMLATDAMALVVITLNMDNSNIMRIMDMATDATGAMARVAMVTTAITISP